VRQAPPRARPAGTVTGATSPGNTAELSRELSGGVVADGEARLAVARAGWTLVRGGPNEVRTSEHGTHPLPGRLPDTADHTTSRCPDQGAT
jgi:hypothetical protein